MKGKFSLSPKVRCTLKSFSLNRLYACTLVPSNESMLGMLTSKSFSCNLIVIAHGTYQDLPDGTTKIFPQGVGQKLSPKIPQYFPNYVRYKNLSGKRTIQLESDGMIDLANTNPNAFEKKTLSIETGLAEFFAALREPPAQPKVKSLKRT